jgi:membrane fusion protein, multidrug efflux system
VNGDGKAESRPIETGEWRENYFLVISGLKPGDRVITSELMKLKPGAPVKVVEEQPKRAAAAPAAR